MEDGHNGYNSHNSHNDHNSHHGYLSQHSRMKKHDQIPQVGGRKGIVGLRAVGWIVGSLVVAAVVVWTAVWWRPWESGRATLTAEAAAQSVLKQYPGEIVNSTLKDGTYMIQLRSETGLYDIQLDALTGTVQAIKRLEAGERSEEKPLLSREQVKTELSNQTVGQLESLELTEKDGSPVYTAVVQAADNSRAELTIDPYEGKVLSSKKLQPSDRKPDGESAAHILTEKEAERKALARVPGEVDDIELRSTDDGIAYYLVDIDLEDGREATVQVNAISGDIRSVTWDKDDD